LHNTAIGLIESGITYSTTYSLTFPDYYWLVEDTNINVHWFYVYTSCAYFTI